MSLARAETAMHCAPSPPTAVGGEGWGEGETHRGAESLQKSETLPPHPNLSPSRAMGERGASARESRESNAPMPASWVRLHMVLSELDYPFWSSLRSSHRDIALRVGDVARYPSEFARREINHTC